MNVKRLATASSLVVLLLASAPAVRADGMDNPIGGPNCMPAAIEALLQVALTGLDLAAAVL